MLQSGKNDMSKKLNSCLCKICNIYWPNKISIEELYKKTNAKSIEIKTHRLRWFGHVLRMLSDRMPNVALMWTPPGKRKRGRL